MIHCKVRHGRVVLTTRGEGYCGKFAGAFRLFSDPPPSILRDNCPPLRCDTPHPARLNIPKGGRGRGHNVGKIERRRPEVMGQQTAGVNRCQALAREGSGEAGRGSSVPGDEGGPNRPTHPRG